MAQLREDTASSIREVENVLQSFELREWQVAALEAWAAADFVPGAAGPVPDAVQLPLSARRYGR